MISSSKAQQADKPNPKNGQLPISKDGCGRSQEELGARLDAPQLLQSQHEESRSFQRI